MYSTTKKYFIFNIIYLVRIPTPLISRITEDITDQVQAGVPANIATVGTLDDIAEELGYDDVAKKFII